MVEPKSIDVWMQHPTERFASQPMFRSLRKWTRSFTKEDGGANISTVPPIQMTLKMMDMAGVSQGLLSAWSSPSGPLITNQEVLSRASLLFELCAGCKLR